MAEDRSRARAGADRDHAGASGGGLAGGLRRGGRACLAARAWACLILVALAGPAQAQATRIAVDLDAGAILLEDEADAPRRPASLTKLMTAYLAFEALESGAMEADAAVTISAYAAARPPVKLGMKPGSEIPFEDLLGAAVVGSRNDAATAVAEALAGEEAAFVERMNAAARALGMVNTRFVNPTGLPAKGQQTSARDIALLATALLTRYPERSALFSRRSVKAGGKRVGATNPLFGRAKGALGLKTGFTCDAGYSIAALVERDGRRVLAVTLGYANKAERLKAATALIAVALKAPIGEETLAPGAVQEDAAPDIKACSGRGAEIIATDIPTPVDADLYLAGVVAAPRPLPAPSAPVPQVHALPQAVAAPPLSSVVALAPRVVEPQTPARPPPPPPLQGWAVFLGAHMGAGAAEAVIRAAQGATGLSGYPHTELRRRDGRMLAVIHGLTQAQAGALCRDARGTGRYCVALSPARLTNRGARWRR